MSSSAISEAIILIGVVIAASTLSQVFLTSISEIQASSIETSDRLSEKMKTNIKVLYAANVSQSAVKIWVKNIGSVTLSPPLIENCDLLFGRIGGNIELYTYSASGVGWNYTILNGIDSKWHPGETMELALTPSESLSQGQYYVSFATHNGVKDEHLFSVGE